MLLDRYLDVLPNPILSLYDKFEESIILDIVRRLVKLKPGKKPNTAAWQVMRLQESGIIYDKILQEIAKLTGKTETELRAIFKNAGVKTLRFDDAIYIKAGFNPVPINMSPAMGRVLQAGIDKTFGLIKNFTLSTALTGQTAFIDAADLAYMQVTTGAMSYDQAIIAAIENVAESGLPIVYPSGRKDRLDVAMRRTVLTGVAQTANELQIARAGEMDHDLVEVSAHVGARNKGEGPMNHESWQGKIYSLSGKSDKYPNFYEVTGYGTGEGLGGYNCVIGETLVSGPAPSAAYKREYSGEIVVIRTASGKELSVTPNHPILTNNGWVAAGLLNCGDYVISRTNFNGVGSSCPHVNKYEPRIKDVFDSLSKIWNVFRLPSSSGYFHGDISDGDINAVFPKGFLLNRDNAALFQQIKKVFFFSTSKSSGSLAANSRINNILFSSLHTPNSIMSRFGKSVSPFLSGSHKAVCHCIRSVFCNRNSEIGKVSSNKTFRNSYFGCNFIFPHSRLIHRKKLDWRNARLPFQISNPISAVINTISFEEVLNGVQRAPEFISDKLKGLSGIVQFDNITFIERKSTQGSFIHVYNLSTKGEWYFANGIITHNCRHSFYPFFEGISRRNYDDATLQDYADKTVRVNGKDLSIYEAAQLQRYAERKIREWKRRQMALEAAGYGYSPECVNALQKVDDWQAFIRGVVKQSGLPREYTREQI